LAAAAHAAEREGGCREDRGRSSGSDGSKRRRISEGHWCLPTPKRPNTQAGGFIPPPLRGLPGVTISGSLRPPFGTGGSR
jgi:hypothetical protein